MYLAFAGQKGGSGKTVLSLHVSYFLSLKSKTALIDADSIKGATHWNERSEGKLGVQVYTTHDADSYANGPFSVSRPIILTHPNRFILAESAARN